MNKNLNILLIVLLFLLPTLWAPVAAEEINLTKPGTEVSPMDKGDYMTTLHFGPNAFPVPDMLDGRLQHNLKLELAGDAYFSFDEDWTSTLWGRLYIPVFSDRINLTVWMPVVEGYWMNAASQRRCHVNDTLSRRGTGIGDIYLSTDIQVLRSKRWIPDLAVRVAMKTASGSQTVYGRYYDDPAYWFDFSLGKSIYIRNGAMSPQPSSQDGKLAGDEWEIRLALSSGFLCWQTRTSSQDDAVQYGVQFLLRKGRMSGCLTYSGYSGWRKNGDRPMTLKAELRGYLGRWEPFFVYQLGLRDYPYNQFRLGLACQFDILEHSFKNKE